VHRDLTSSEEDAMHPIITRAIAEQRHADLIRSAERDPPRCCGAAGWSAADR
jgi:hypothetical protein